LKKKKNSRYIEETSFWPCFVLPSFL